jgi:hypothetical protein
MGEVTKVGPITDPTDAAIPSVSTDQSHFGGIAPAQSPICLV